MGVVDVISMYVPRGSSYLSLVEKETVGRPCNGGNSEGVLMYSDAVVASSSASTASLKSAWNCSLGVSFIGPAMG
jgi:hypothetical protein